MTEAHFVGRFPEAPEAERWWVDVSVVGFLAKVEMDLNARPGSSPEHRYRHRYALPPAPGLGTDRLDGWCLDEEADWTPGVPEGYPT